jgi:high-affinity iron transporter
MLATLIIAFREVIEASLVIGIVLAATRGVPYRTRWVAYGVLGGIAGACLVAAFADAISNAMSGVGHELFDAAILLTAVVMLTWHNVWMAKHGREIATHMKNIGAAVAAGDRTLLALSIVVGIAVLREGSELVLFLYGISVSGNETVTNMATGGLLGIGLGIVIGAVTYTGLARIPSRYLFSVTGTLIALLAAGMAAQAIMFLQQAQVVTVLSEIMWNTSGILSASSLGGKILHTLIGYTDRPTEMQVVAYVMTLTIIFALMRMFGGPAKQTAHNMASVG